MQLKNKKKTTEYLKKKKKKIQNTDKEEISDLFSKRFLAAEATYELNKIKEMMRTRNQ